MPEHYDKVQSSFESPSFGASGLCGAAVPHLEGLPVGAKLLLEHLGLRFIFGSLGAAATETEALRFGFTLP